MKMTVPMMFSLALLGVGEMPITGEMGPWISGSALVMLGGCMAKLFIEISAQRADAKEERRLHAETLDKLCNRWDGWENTRHQDSAHLNETLTKLRENCAINKPHEH